MAQWESRAASSRARDWRLRRGLLFPLLALSIGCATADTSVLYSASLNDLPRPPVMLIDTFSFQVDSVTVDTVGPEIATGDKGTRDERLELGRTVAEALAQKIVTQMREVGIEARRHTAGAAPPMNALVVKGQFVEIDEGDQSARVTLGFGAGTEEIRTRIQVYQADANGGLKRIRETLGEAHGDKMPGMAAPVAVGAAAGNVVVSAAVSGGLNVASELNTGLDKAAQNLAEQLAERAQTVYKDRGWLN